ncbi:aminotransferase class IV [Spongiimicrobium sp. 3-5]|uniref:aminotransferase class IV n=1 Tax=Spongiimicrobium sp. 3-5 TaxID=3332596 RepID=UPI003980F507
MVNYNGNLLPREENSLNHTNRGLRYGDALFETIRVLSGKVVFWEDHYLRLMASMRMLRMEIPMNFTMEFLEQQIHDTVTANGLEKAAARVRLTVFRNPGGLYLPKTNDVSFVVEVVPLKTANYVVNTAAYEVELFKDFYVNQDILSTLKTNNKALNVVGSIFAKENGYDNCLLLNNSKQVVEALNGNVFLVTGNTIKTPPLQDGCLNGIIRKRLVALLLKSGDYVMEEASISPFELQKVDEMFITNTVIGVQSVTQYRKKKYATQVATALLNMLNTDVNAQLKSIGSTN